MFFCHCCLTLQAATNIPSQINSFKKLPFHHGFDNESLNEDDGVEFAYWSLGAVTWRWQVHMARGILSLGSSDRKGTIS